MSKGKLVQVMSATTSGGALKLPLDTSGKLESTQSEIIPEACPQSQEYLQALLAKTDLEELMFEDHLVTASDTGKELGEFSISMEKVRRWEQTCVLVHASSRGTVDGVPCGTSIVCYVLPTLETLEQHHHEFVKLERRPLDRKTTIIKGEDSYVVNQMVTRGPETSDISKEFSLDTMQGFISEGSNMLLQRILIVNGLSQELQFISFDSENALCTCVYRTLQERTQTVAETTLRVLGMERIVDSKHDFPLTWQSYFTEEGFLANRAQIGSPVTMTLQNMPRKQYKEKRDKPVFEKKPLNWEEDIQMYSAFLDRKEELKNSHLVFLRHHPELRALLADFLQFLLLSKPEDALAFSADYFAAFSATITPTPCYKASAIPPLVPHCHTNEQIDKLRSTSLKRM